jgi:hypothetical protein
MKELLKHKFFRFLLTLAVAVGLYYTCPVCMNKTYWIAILAVFFLLINLQEYLARFTVLTTISRVLVGVLFIVSGLIKANDAVGFSYKLEEYFEVFGEGFSCNQSKAVEQTAECPPDETTSAQIDTTVKKESVLKPVFDLFKSIALPLAIIICIVEVILGFTTLLGTHVRLSLWLLFSLIIFFSFLTFYSACCNKVTDCGCFGDALKLTPWESFSKDIILLFFIMFIYIGRDSIYPAFGDTLMKILLVLIVIASIAFPIYTYRNLPVVDFRPYKIGSDIKAGMELAPDAPRDSVVMIFIYEKGGVKKEFTMEEVVKGKVDSTYKFKCRIDRKVREGVKPKIHDFTISATNGDNITDILLSDPDYNFVLICHDLGKTNTSVQGKVNDFFSLCKKDKVKFIAITSSGKEAIDKFKAENKNEYDFYIADDTMLKTMIRSNPGLILLKKGVVVDMWHYNNLPSFTDVKKKYFSK